MARGVVILMGTNHELYRTLSSVLMTPRPCSSPCFPGERYTITLQLLTHLTRPHLFMSAGLAASGFDRMEWWSLGFMYTLHSLNSRFIYPTAREPFGRTPMRTPRACAASGPLQVYALGMMVEGMLCPISYSVKQVSASSQCADSHDKGHKA
jgi:hypothetical protein